jgi:hypothetical protein
MIRAALTTRSARFAPIAEDVAAFALAGGVVVHAAANGLPLVLIALGVV